VVPDWNTGKAYFAASGSTKCTNVVYQCHGAWEGVESTSLSTSDNSILLIFSMLSSGPMTVVIGQFRSERKRNPSNFLLKIKRDLNPFAPTLIKYKKGQILLKWT
jgi:hypothetical protein